MTQISCKAWKTDMFEVQNLSHCESINVTGALRTWEGYIWIFLEEEKKIGIIEEEILQTTKELDKSENTLKFNKNRDRLQVEFGEWNKISW